MATQKSFVDRVVHDFDVPAGDAEEFLDFALGEPGDRQNPPGTLQDMPRELKVQGTPQARMVVSAVHVVEDVVDGHDIGARQVSRHRKNMRNVNQFAMQPLDDGTAFKVALYGGVRLEQGDALKIRRQWSNLRYFLRRTDQEILVRMVEPGERPYYVPRVGANAKFRDPPYVDGNLHGMI